MRLTLILLTALVFVGGPAAAQSADVVVGVPIQNGKAGKPRPGVIVHPNAKKAPLQGPIVLPQSRTPGTTTVRPNFGGGYTIETPGAPAQTVRPRFGGGYAVDEGGRTTTEVVPLFGGGYRVEREPGSPEIVLPAPER